MRSIGRAGNGLVFGHLRDDYTIFGHVAVAVSCHSLPNIADSQIQLCPASLDHCTSSEKDCVYCDRVATVPLSPYGVGIAKQAAQDLIPGEPLEYVSGWKGYAVNPKNSKTFSRMRRMAYFRQ